MLLKSLRKKALGTILKHYNPECNGNVQYFDYDSEPQVLFIGNSERKKIASTLRVAN